MATTPSSFNMQKSYSKKLVIFSKQTAISLLKTVLLSSLGTPRQWTKSLVAFSNAATRVPVPRVSARASIGLPQKFIETEAPPWNASADELGLTCPLCFGHLIKQDNAARSTYVCQICAKGYHTAHGITDLTLPDNISAGCTSFFQNPLVAYIYDRGYRQLFKFGNFPGFDEEFRMAQELMEPAAGKVIMDLSCAGGSMTKRFVSSNVYKLVVAADISEAMMQQCRNSLLADPRIDMRKVMLVHADAARLPFRRCSFSAIHAGAAIHCWPLTTAIAEVTRVLKPGGIFVATTYVVEKPPLQWAGIINPIRQSVAQLQVGAKLWTEEELKDIVESCGLTEWKSIRRGPFILFSVLKP